MTKVQQVRATLHEAQALVRRGGLVQGADALDARGVPCFPTSRRASAWSVCGALLVVARNRDGEVFLGALYALAEAVGISVGIGHRALCAAVWAWEDSTERTLHHVMDAFESAKEATDGEQEAETERRDTEIPEPC